MVDQGIKNLADWIDQNILADIYRAQKAMNEAPVPMIGRYYWNPETDEVVAVDDL